jgi:hypothetical protein
MDVFPTYPLENHQPTSHYQLYIQIRQKVQFALTLVETEEVDVIRLKTSGDQLERCLEDVQKLLHRSLSVDWMQSVCGMIQTSLDRVRQVQGRLLNE